MRLLLLLLFYSTCLAEPTVVASQSVPSASINHQELVRIFTRKEMFWPSGQKISVFIKPVNSIEHKIFTINILNLSPYKYKNLTESVIYAGSNNPPTEIQTDEQMLSVLERTPNSIGYVNYSIMFNKDDRLVTIKVE